jgi:hypothetical protein
VAQPTAHASNRAFQRLCKKNVHVFPTEGNQSFSANPDSQLLNDCFHKSLHFIVLWSYMSSFIALKLDLCCDPSDTLGMNSHATPTTSRQVARLVRQRIERGGEHLWRFDDFRDLPFPAVAQALSRLTRSGTIDRLSKGVYYRTRQTTFGKSRPNPAAMQKLASRRKTVFPAGIAAANLLGFTTQSAARSEVATSALSLPRKLVGAETVVHTRRPEAWTNLSDSDAALLDFLRRQAKPTELSPEATVQRVLDLMSEEGRFERLLKVAQFEPPRVRAMLGALGEQLAKSPKSLEKLHASLNPLSRFDFGPLAGLLFARHWQAKEQPRRATVRAS